MSTKRSIFLHIGTHKTGTKSLQEYLHRNRSSLKTAGFAFYHGLYMPQNHGELHAAAMHPERGSPFKQYHGITDIVQLRRQTEQHVATFVEEHSQRNLIFSAEGLAYLRYDHEIRFLAGLLQPESTTVVVYLRNPAAFLRSYRRQLLRMGLSLSMDRESYAYCESDSWLVNYNALIDAYSRHFRDIRVLRYDETLTRDGTIIPSFLDEIGLRGYDAIDTRIFLNITPP